MRVNVRCLGAIPVAAIFVVVGIAWGSVPEDNWLFVLEFGDFSGAPDIAIDSRGEVYVLTGDRVQVFASDGQYLRDGPGFIAARGIAIDENDRVYVLEPCRVHRYTTAFEALGSWDSCIGQGDLQQGRGIDARGGIVYVATVGNVLIFTSDGQLIAQLPNGWSDVQATEDRSVWVVRPLGATGLVRHYSPDGQVLAEWNTVLPGEESSSPVGITVDSRGHVFVADGRVKIFTPDGGLEDLIEAPFRLMLAVQLDGDRILYVGADLPGRVMKFFNETAPVEPVTWGFIKAAFR